MIALVWIALYLLLGYLTVFLISLAAPPPDEMTEILAIIGWPVVALLALMIVVYSFFETYVAGIIVSPSSAAKKVKERNRMLKIESNSKDLHDT